MPGVSAVQQQQVLGTEIRSSVRTVYALFLIISFLKLKYIHIICPFLFLHPKPPVYPSFALFEIHYLFFSVIVATCIHLYMYT